MLWKKELNKLNAYDISGKIRHILKDWFALPEDNKNASSLKKSKEKNSKKSNRFYDEDEL